MKNGEIILARRLSLAAVIALMAGLLAACSTTPPPPESPLLEASDWLLLELREQDPLSAAEVSLSFAWDQVSGSDGCNRYLATYRADNGALEIGPFGPSTLMACEPGLEAQAERFRSALQSARRYAVDGERLQLLGDDGVVLAVFERQPLKLAGTRWRVTSYDNGKGGAVSVLGGTSLTVAFRTDGTVSGSAGCNSFRAGYRQDGEGLSLGAVAFTRQLCARPRGVMEQEQRFFTALKAVAKMEQEGSRLRLRTSAGALVMQLAPQAGPDAGARVTGTATYRERIALPPAAVLTVRLADVSRTDAPAVVLAEQRIEVGSGGVPISFEVPYDAAAVDPRHRYALQARIEASGKLLFVSDQHHGVITQGAPSHVDMVLRQVEASR